MKRSMIDIEALDLRETAIILSIGIANIDDPSEQYHLIPNLIEQERQGRTMSIGTVAWWMQQSDEAKRVFEFAPKQHNRDIAMGLYKIVDEADEIWASGTSYDFKILSSYLKTFMPDLVWPFFKERDWRTMRQYFDERGEVKPEFVGTQHNALADTQHQAAHMRAVEDRLNKALGGR